MQRTSEESSFCWYHTILHVVCHNAEKLEYEIEALKENIRLILFLVLYSPFMTFPSTLDLKLTHKSLRQYLCFFQMRYGEKNKVQKINLTTRTAIGTLWEFQIFFWIKLVPFKKLLRLPPELIRTVESYLQKQTFDSRCKTTEKKCRYEKFSLWRSYNFFICFKSCIQGSGQSYDRSWIDDVICITRFAVRMICNLQSWPLRFTAPRRCTRASDIQLFQGNIK